MPDWAQNKYPTWHCLVIWLNVSVLFLRNVRTYINTLGTVAKPGGRLVFSMNNPYSLVVRGHITDYFDTGNAYPYRGIAEAGVKVHFYQRTLEQYLDACLTAGFQLQRLLDVPTPEGSFKRRNDTLIPEGYQFPFFMILSFIKPI